MVQQKMRFANLDESSLNRIKKMEEAMGSVILAVEPVYPVAELSPEQVERLQAVEKELGVVIVAYKIEKGVSG